MQFSHGVSSRVVFGRKVTSCLHAAARVARRCLLVRGAAFDARKLRFAGGVWPASCSVKAAHLEWFEGDFWKFGPRTETESCKDHRHKNNNLESWN